MQDPSKRQGIWTILKDLVGKDMTRFCVPVYFNEPISMVQKVAEGFEYAQLLDVADETDDPVERLAMIAAWGVSNYK